MCRVTFDVLNIFCLRELPGGCLLSVGLSLLQRLQRIHKCTSLSRTYKRAEHELLPHRHLFLQIKDLAQCNRWLLDIIYFSQQRAGMLISQHSRGLPSRNVVNLRCDSFSRPAARVRLNRWCLGSHGMMAFDDI